MLHSCSHEIVNSYIACMPELRGRTVIRRRLPPNSPEGSHLRIGLATAGIYYAPGSLKAKLSVDGNLNRLEPYCQEHGVPFRRLGKLLVATDQSQIGKLRELQENGRKNGVRTGCLQSLTAPCAARGGSLLSECLAETNQQLSLSPPKMQSCALCLILCAAPKKGCSASIAVSCATYPAEEESGSHKSVPCRCTWSG